jgi:GNAT superfamily N-acetyltransferase
MPVFRTATVADIPALTNAWYAMLDECGLLGSGVVDDWQERLARHFQHQMERGHARWFVAEDDGRIAGTALATLSSGRSNILKDLSAMLAGIYVYPEFRGRGIARELTERAIAWCKERGCVRVRLNASAMGRPLYESLGFVQATEMMRLDLR